MQRLGRHKVWGLSGLSLWSVLQRCAWSRAPHACLVITAVTLTPTINPKSWAKPQIFLFY